MEIVWAVWAVGTGRYAETVAGAANCRRIAVVISKSGVGQIGMFDFPVEKTFYAGVGGIKSDLRLPADTGKLKLLGHNIKYPQTDGKNHADDKNGQQQSETSPLTGISNF